MVALVLVAHSRELVSGLRAMVAQNAPAVAVTCAAGTASGALGTSSPAVLEALNEALVASNGDGALVMLDLGSAALAVELALEELPPLERSQVRVSGAPFVEGAILAAVESAAGVSLDGVARAAESAFVAPKLLP